MYWLTVATISFGLIALAEFGDKTQIMTVTLASRYRRVPVFAGVVSGLTVVTVFGVLVGTVLYSFIPITAVKLLAAGLFIFFGVHTLISKEDDDFNDIDDKGIFRNSFVLSSVAEFGDKTQFAVIALTARYGAPLPVLLGAIGGLALVVGIGTVVGGKISLYADSHKIRKVAGIIFVVIGLIFMLEAVLFG